MHARHATRVFAIATFLLAAVLLAGCSPSPKPPRTPPHPALEGKLCAACHKFAHKVPYTGACGLCHVLTSWRMISYEHTVTAMDSGFHAVVGCRACHTEGKPAPSPACEGCHDSSPHGGSKRCAWCHMPVSWRVNLPTPAGHFPLTGKHVGLGCLACHRTGNERPVARCSACHGTKHGGLTDCARCHVPTGFLPARFEHSSVFALTGRHASLACSRCHAGNLYARVAGRRCVDCHGSRHGGLTDCSRCHSTSGFSPARFRHSSVFALTGRHARLACTACHPHRRYAHVSGTHCVDCHGVRHGGLTQCGSCHSTSGFLPARFSHPSSFPLTGRHAALACTRCHPSSDFSRVAGTRCVDCHGVHHSDQRSCARCHTTAGFTPIVSSFRHTTRFPLLGRHAQITCRACHTGLVFPRASTACSSCHTAPHVGPADCGRCHAPAAPWTTATFTHPAMPAAHAGQDIDDACTACHTGGNYTVVSCLRCHPTFGL
ncbi:MAG: hypothetical protein WC971_07340 [Coriobacteriia bacterium]